MGVDILGPNAVPNVDAGIDQSIAYPISMVTLAGNATDDGLIAPLFHSTLSDSRSRKLPLYLRILLNLANFKR